MKRHEFDGVLMGDARDQIWRVYEPRWWELGRWLRWFWRVAFPGRYVRGTVVARQSLWNEREKRYEHRDHVLRCFLARKSRASMLEGEN